MLGLLVFVAAGIFAEGPEHRANSAEQNEPPAHRDDAIGRHAIMRMGYADRIKG